MSFLGNYDTVSSNLGCPEGIHAFFFNKALMSFREALSHLGYSPVIDLPMIRVFIVDDQPAFRHQLHNLLVYAGISVVGEAGSIMEALEKLPCTSPDFAIVDVEMPGISGIDGVSFLKQVVPGLRVFLVSAYLDRSELLVQAAEKVGAEAFIPKERLDLELVKSWKVP